MKKSANLATARRDGARSARIGLLRIANPYFDDQEAATAWREGYDIEWSARLRLERKLAEDLT